MNANRTALAKFLDVSALWSACLLGWFAWLFARLNRLYAALALACLCAGATIALFYLARRFILSHRRGDGISREEALALCSYIALAPPDAALSALAAWLMACGKYSKCEVRAGVIIAQSAIKNPAQKPARPAAQASAQLSRPRSAPHIARQSSPRPLAACPAPAEPARLICLISKWPGEKVSAQDALEAYRRCQNLQGENSPAGGETRAIIAATAEFTPEAEAFARRVGAALIDPAALCALMRAALPICGEARAKRPARGALRALICRANAGRFGAYALALALFGRILGLPYCSAAGLICAALWLCCAAQPKARAHDAWI